MDSEKSEALLQWVRLKQIKNIKEIQINCDIYVILDTLILDLYCQIFMFRFS